ncbi:MAG: hypothetical protein J7647_26575 [Cyanobacteria bacterium SBLK]|nr:hypothetical protein [Cyanobacteria bacterium SBLK]
MNTRPNVNEGEIISVGENNHLERIRKEIANLSIDEKAKLAKELLPGGITVILGGNNMVNTSFAFQLNGDTDELSEQLKDMPAECLGELLKAIAMKIQKDSLIKPESDL